MNWNGTRDKNSFFLAGLSKKDQVNRFSTRYLLSGLLTLEVPEFMKYNGEQTVVLKDLKKELPFDYTINLNSSPGCKMYKKKLMKEFSGNAIGGGNFLSNIQSGFLKWQIQEGNLPDFRGETGSFRVILDIFRSF